MGDPFMTPLRERPGDPEGSVGMSAGPIGSLQNGLLFALAVTACLVTGCNRRHNEYIVELKPQGSGMERTLVFHRGDGVKTNTGTRVYPAFDAAELGMITALYPTQSLTNVGNRYTIRGKFTNELPADVGGVGVFTNVSTSLGTVGYYSERFRGNDDLVGMAERRHKAVDQLADIFVGWSQMELGREPGYAKLRKFLAVDFRRDLKNFSSYGWELQQAGAYKTDATEEFAVRFAQYLFERGYFTIGEIPGLLRDVAIGDPQGIPMRIQRLLARKMGVPDAAPIPPSLAFLSDETKLGKSFDKYLAGTELYRAKLKQWKKDKQLKPDTEKPKPEEVMRDAVMGVDLFGGWLENALLWEGDHLVVRLSLPEGVGQVRGNGRGDEALKQVVWETHIKERTNATRLPFSCYASWTQANEEYQKQHFGKATLTGDELMKYCLWRSGLDMQRGSEWDTFLSSLQPGPGLMDGLDTFRFLGESDQAATNSLEKIPGTSQEARELLQTALRKRVTH